MSLSQCEATYAMSCACLGFGTHFTSLNAPKYLTHKDRTCCLKFSSIFEYAITVVVARQSTSTPARPSEAQKYDTVGKLF
jgi:hypothetical protein